MTKTGRNVAGRKTLLENKMLFHQEIPYNPLTREQKDFCRRKLVRTNLLFKKWEVHYTAHEAHIFRAKTLGGDKNPLNKIPSTQIKAFERDIPDLICIRNQSHYELDGKTIEQAVLEGFSALCKAHARKWSKDFGPSNNGATFRDYLQETYFKLVEAMYSYTKIEFDLSTFFWWCLHNRMINVTHKYSFMKLTADELELVVKYEKTKIQANKKVNFDEITEMMNLNHEESIHLGNILNTVVFDSSLGNNDRPTVVQNDYTGERSSSQLGMTVSMERDEDLEENSIDSNMLKEAIVNAGLTNFEKELIAEELKNPVYGWQIEFARNSFNPNTGKPYSRMWITYAVKNAHEKLRKYLEKDYTK